MKQNIEEIEKVEERSDDCQICVGKKVFNLLEKSKIIPGGIRECILRDIILLQKKNPKIYY